MEQETIRTQHEELKKVMKLGIYMRCSTETQELILQEESTNKFVSRLKEDNPTIEYITTQYKDKGISGKNTDRPSLQKLLDDVRKKNINCVIITKLDRLGRSLQNLLEIATEFKNNNVDFIVIEQHLDTSTAQGKLLFHILGAFAEFEREMIRERMQGGRKKAELSGSKSGKPCHRPKSSLDEDGVVKKFENGMSMNQISKTYEVSITPIRRILISRGLIK